jgi:hypothetical protein
MRVELVTREMQLKLNFPHFTAIKHVAILISWDGNRGREEYRFELGFLILQSGEAKQFFLLLKLG